MPRAKPKPKTKPKTLPKKATSEIDVINKIRNQPVTAPLEVNLFDPERFKIYVPVEESDIERGKKAVTPRDRNVIKLVKARCSCGKEELVNPAFIDRRVSADSEGVSGYKCNGCSVGPRKGA